MLRKNKFKHQIYCNKTFTFYQLSKRVSLSLLFSLSVFFFHSKGKHMGWNIVMETIKIPVWLIHRTMILFYIGNKDNIKMRDLLPQRMQQISKHQQPCKIKTLITLKAEKKQNTNLSAIKAKKKKYHFCFLQSMNSSLQKCR